MYVLLMHPAVAARSCSDCVQWMHDDRGGTFGPPLLRGGNKIPRAKGTPTPCRVCPKIPAGAEPKPENAVELTSANRQAFAFYRECRAVGEFPADAIVRRNAAIIREVEDLVEKTERQEQMRTMARAAAARGR